MINASDSYGIPENFYLPIQNFNGFGMAWGCKQRTEEQLPKSIEEKDELLAQLGSPFVKDTSNDNDGYPIFDWEK